MRRFISQPYARKATPSTLRLVSGVADTRPPTDAQAILAALEGLSQKVGVLEKRVTKLESERATATACDTGRLEKDFKQLKGEIMIKYDRLRSAALIFMLVVLGFIWKFRMDSIRENSRVELIALRAEAKAMGAMLMWKAFRHRLEE